MTAPSSDVIFSAQTPGGHARKPHSSQGFYAQAKPQWHKSLVPRECASRRSPTTLVAKRPHSTSPLIRRPRSTARATHPRGRIPSSAPRGQHAANTWPARSHASGSLRQRSRASQRRRAPPDEPSDVLRPPSRSSAAARLLLHLPARASLSRPASRLASGHSLSSLPLTSTAS